MRIIELIDVVHVISDTRVFELMLILYPVHMDIKINCVVGWAELIWMGTEGSCYRF